MKPLAFITLMIIINQYTMGGNGAYIVSYNGVPMRNRTHIDTDYRIGGHKVLVQSGNPQQNKTPMNSNSSNPIYLCGKTDKHGKITITTIGIYDKHRLVMTIDIKYNKDGKVIPYSNGGKGTTHAHKWFTDDSLGEVGRKPHDPKNILPYSHKYDELLEKISRFNNKVRVWK